ncbi:unnamed protein product [Adineta steineri]|uniref:mitogen-activated protein kinase n=1 Tax=Adineta steineri TaxID=433720 RepID=A0A818UYN3_9BILA|nr:unnamed protein product [Adineta steineri]
MATDANTDQTQWHTVTCNGFNFTLPIRYKDPDHIGQGAFGSVIRATDTKTNKQVAIKKIRNPFPSHEHAKRTYRELKLLIHLNQQDTQIVQIYNVFTPDQHVNQFQTLYFILEYYPYDLHQFIKRNKSITEEHIKLIIYSLFRGLKFMHSAGVIHRDLKPSNIGIDDNCNVAVSFTNSTNECKI